MAQRGVIQSRLRLDAKEFYTRLDAALKKAQQTAAAMQKVFGKPLTLPSIPTPSSSPGRGSGSRGDSALAVQREEARKATAAFKDYQLALKSGEATEADFLSQATALGAQLREQRSQLDRTSKGYDLYTEAIRKVVVGVREVEAAQEKAAAADAKQLRLTLQAAEAEERAAQQAAAAAEKAAAAQIRAVQRAQAAAEKAAKSKAEADEKSAERSRVAAEKAGAAQVKAAEQASAAAKRASESKAAAVPFENARQGASAVKDLELAYRKGRISLDDLITGARRWEAQLEAERSQLAENTKGYAAYTVALRAVENVTSRGGNTRPVTSGIDNISDALDRLQAAGALFLTGGFFARFFGGLDRSARNTTQAKNALTLYRNELRDAGRDVDAEVARLDKLAARFKTNTEALSRFALILTRQGFTGQEQAELIEAVGASALNAGRDLNEAFGTAADAFARQDSALLNGLGIITNFDDALQDYAKTQGKTAESLDQSSRNQAIYTRFIAETRQEVAALDVLLAGYAGSSASLENAQLSLGRTIGGVVSPALGLLKDSLTLILNLFNALPGPIKVVAVAAGVLTTIIAGLGVAYVTLRTLLFNQTVLGPVVATLLKNETVLRSRLGAAIIVQSRAYGLLDKEQVRSAVTSRNAAIASAAAAGGTTRLATALGLLSKIRPFVVITALVAIAREAAKYLGVFQPIVDNVRTSLSGLGDTRAGKFIGDLTEKAGGLGQVFSGAVLRGVTLVSLVLASLLAVVKKVGIGFQFLGDITTKGPEEAFRLLNQRTVALESELANMNVAILDSAVGFQKQIDGAKGAAGEIDKAATSTAKLTEEQKKQRADFQGRAAEFQLSFDQTGLEADIASAESSIQDFIDEIGAAADALPLGSKLREEYRTIELDLLKLRQNIGGKVIAEALTAAQNDTASAVVASMQEGAAKIIAQRDIDLEAERKAFEERTNALVKGSETYNEFLALYEAKAGAIRGQANQALEQDAEQRLETQRQLVSDLADLQGQIAVAEAEASGNTVAAINARSLESARQIEGERLAMLARVEGNDQASRERRAQINTLYDQKERQNTEQLSRDLETEQQRRADSLETITRRTAELRAQTLASQQRDSGNEQGAVETELKSRLSAIDAALDDELEAEGLTQKEITALHVEANAQRVAARQQAAQATKAIIQQERDAAKQALAESEAGLEQAKSGDVQGEIGALRAQFAAEQAQRRRDDQQRLADFKGTEAEKQRLLSDASQRELILTRQNLLQINRLDKEARQDYADAVKEYQQQVTDAYVSALQTQINKLTELRDVQTSIVSSGSTILQFIKNREELTGGAGGANDTQVDNFLKSQLRGYEDLYRESLKANGPLEDRVELQEKIKKLREDAQAEGYTLTLDPAIARLMEGDEISQVATFPAKAAEALENTKALDERIADATAMLTDLLGEAATDEGLRLKVTIDKSGLEQAKQELANAFGPEQANKIIGQVNDIGKNAGAGLMATFAEGITANRQRIADALRAALEPVRDLLPSSPAKYGPLSDIDWSGGRLPLTFAEGMRRQFPALRSTALQMASIAKPALAIPSIPTVRASPFAAAGAGGQSFGDTIINVSGSGARSSAILQQEGRQFAQSAMREAKLITRRRR